MNRHSCTAEHLGFALQAGDRRVRWRPVDVDCLELDQVGELGELWPRDGEVPIKRLGVRVDVDHVDRLPTRVKVDLVRDDLVLACVDERSKLSERGDQCISLAGSNRGSIDIDDGCFLGHGPIIRRRFSGP